MCLSARVAEILYYLASGINRYWIRTFFSPKFWILITVFRLALIETENIRTPSGKLYESLSIVAAAINDSVLAL